MIFMNLFCIIICWISFGGICSAFPGLPLPNLDKDSTCLACKTYVTTIRIQLDSGASVDDIVNLAVNFCQSAHLFTDDVCLGMATLAGPELIYILNNTEHSSSNVCGFFLGGDHCPEDQLPEWEVTIPGAKPVVNHSEPVMVYTFYALILQQPSSPVKILHISDTHIDLKYTEGEWDECEHPLCCRPWNDDVPEGAEKAGKWGAKGTCDIPLKTLDVLVEAAVELKPDLVYVTGDLPAHDVWDQTHESNLASIDASINVFKKHFPNTSVIFAMGNHESAPVNSFSMPSTYSSGYDMHWLYDHLADSWTYWVPEETRGSIRAGGYFHYSPMPGLRVVSMNMNFCNRGNWWVLMDHIDSVSELEWLVSVLRYSEINSEKVHILGHIPGGSDDCWSKWSHQFNRVVTRFESTIAALFYGHHHHDHWEIYWDVDNNIRPVGIGFLPPSGTSSGENNPSYRLYYVDGRHDNATWMVIDHETFSMNLTESNQSEETPEFHLIYRATEAYNLPSLSPIKMAFLSYRMAVDDDLYDEYIRHYYNFYAEPPELITESDPNSRAHRLCKLVTGDSLDMQPCDRMEALVNNGKAVIEKDQLNNYKMGH